MAQSVTYNGTPLTTVRRAGLEITESAELGAVGTGAIVVDDDAGSVTLAGHKAVEVQQSADSPALMWSGFVGRKHISRGTTHATLAGRDIAASVADLNDLLGRLVLRGSSAIRPSETVGARLTWLLASDALASLVADNGLVTYPSTTMDADDYRGQHPGDVLAACAKAVRYNYFVYPDPSTDAASLFFADANTSTAYSSTLRISNVGSDIDNVTTFAARDAILTSDPENVASNVWAAYCNGHVYRTRGSTASNYAARDIVTENAGDKSAATATLRADDLLWEVKSEEHSIEATIRVPAASVNLVRAGHRIEGRFSHFAPEGYASWTWFRVLHRTITQPMDTDTDYDLRLVLSPQEVRCVESELPTFVQYEWVDEDSFVDVPSSPSFTQRYTLPTSTIGNLVLLAVQSPILNDEPIVSAPTGWTWAIQNVETGLQYNNVFWKISAADTSVDLRFTNGDGTRRAMFAEYAGLNNPELFGTVTENLQSPPAPGYAIAPATSYPAGPTAVIMVYFMDDGPQSGDELVIAGTGQVLRTPLDSGVPGNIIRPLVAIGDMLRDSTAGTTPLYPAAGGWRLLFTGSSGYATYTVGLVFEGTGCPE